MACAQTLPQSVQIIVELADAFLVWPLVGLFGVAAAWRLLRRMEPQHFWGKFGGAELYIGSIPEPFFLNVKKDSDRKVALDFEADAWLGPDDLDITD